MTFHLQAPKNFCRRTFVLKENGGTALSLGGSDLFARKSRMSFSVHFLGRGSERMCRHFVALYLPGKSQFGTSFHYGSLASDCCFITYRFWQICISPELPNRFPGSLPKQASDFSGRQIVFLGGQCSVHPSSRLASSTEASKNWTFNT